MRIETPTGPHFLIGDPHLARSFANGTPLHRRGDREKMQMDQFRAELRTPDVHTIVMVGDLFDKPIIPLSILGEVALEVIRAAREQPDKHFVYMAGNHDKSRQLVAMTAWEIFELAVAWCENITVLNEPQAINGVMYYPWQWEMSALEQVEKYGSASCHTAIGHWDLKSFGGDDSHMCPVKALLNLNPNVSLYSGHYHEETTYQVEGINVVCTGSMQPYTHAEDPTGELYVTLTAAEALARNDLRDKCVRILLEPGEMMPEIDCLQLTHKLGATEMIETDLSQIGIGSFDLHAKLADEFNQNEVPDQVQIFIKERLGDFA